MKKRPKIEHEDFEHLLWFFAAHKHAVYEHHIKGLDELESEIGAVNPELHAIITDYIDLYKQKAALKSAPDTDPKKKLAIKEFNRLFDKLREYIRSMSGDE